MALPALKRLDTDGRGRKERVCSLRHAVTDLLASNYLNHFTDHSVDHSDRLCELIDGLTAPFASSTQLNPDEAGVLYFACYLHDIGMQHQRAGETATMREHLNFSPQYKGRAWEALDESTRRELVREQHHRIAAEMVRDAVQAGSPAINLTLVDDDYPGIVAALCEAHCVPTDDRRYAELTADYGSIRVRLLAALLRLADILDESRRRSRLFLEKTRELPLKSRLHWWRHYYVADVIVKPDRRTIEIWFDFPPTRREQYKELIEPLQVPWLTAELQRHSQVLAANNLLWDLQIKSVEVAQSMASPMDDELERYAVECAAERQAERLRQQRIVTAQQLRIGRPTIVRQLEALQSSSLKPEDQLIEAMRLGEHLWKIGGRREASLNLVAHFERVQGSVNERLRLQAVLKIAELALAGGASRSALFHLQPHRAHFERLPLTDSLRLGFQRMWATILRDQCGYSEAVAAFDSVATAEPDPLCKSRAIAEILEMHLLQGNLDRVITGD